MAELKEAGYYQKTPKRNDKGVIVRWDSVVLEMPNAVSIENSGVYPLPNNQDMENQDIDNWECNNNYINNNYKTFSNNHVTSSQDGTDGRKITEFQTLIRKNIGYGDLFVANKEDMPLIDEFVSIILDTLLSEGKTVRINGENKPRELVKANLMKLTYENIIYVLHKFKEQEKRIQKKKQYILTMLYYSTMELVLRNTNI